MNPNKNKILGLIKICKRLKENYPDKHLDFYKILIAVEVLRQVIDNEWVNQTIFQQHNTLDKKNKDAFSFFKSKDIGYAWQNRIYFFSERIFNLRKVKNFDLIKKDIISGQLVSRYAEIEVGKHLMHRGIQFEFVEPKGKKTEDFDIKIIDELIVNCEVKHKIESTILSNNTFKNTLSKANAQLPKSELGIIFVQISQKWSQDANIIEILNRVITPFFRRNNTHIIGIVLRWEEQNSLLNNVFHFMYKLLRNEFLNSNESINTLLNKIENPVVSKNWVSFEPIIKKHML